jgi:hypothetical protein
MKLGNIGTIPTFVEQSLKKKRPTMDNSINFGVCAGHTQISPFVKSKMKKSK